MNLYPISATLAILQERIESAGGEITEELAEHYFATSVDFDSAALDGAAYILSLEAEDEAIQGEIQRLSIRRDGIGLRARAMRDLLSREMLKVDHTKIKDHRFNLNARTGSQQLIIDDITVIPCDLLIPPKPPELRPDKVKIRQEFDAGHFVPGVHFEPGKSILTIK